MSSNIKRICKKRNHYNTQCAYCGRLIPQFDGVLVRLKNKKYKVFCDNDKCIKNYQDRTNV